MPSWEPDPVDIDPTDRDGIGEENVKWNDKFTRDLEIKLNGLRRFNVTLETSSDEVLEKDKVKEGTIELIANQMHDKTVPDHVTFLNQVTSSGNLVQTELPIERKPKQITFG